MFPPVVVFSVVTPLLTVRPVPPPIPSTTPPFDVIPSDARQRPVLDHASRKVDRIDRLRQAEAAEVERPAGVDPRRARGAERVRRAAQERAGVDGRGSRNRCWLPPASAYCQVSFA